MATKEAVAAITKAVVAVMEVEAMEAGAILTPMEGPSKEGMTIREEEAVMANNHPWAAEVQ